LAAWPKRPCPAKNGSHEERILIIDLASTVSSTVHAAAVAAGCLLVVWRLWNVCGDPATLFDNCSSIEHGAGAFELYSDLIAMSIGYFVQDVWLYCVAAGDIPILLHHLVMVGIYYPSGCREVLLSGLPPASANFWVWVGAAAYVCEFATLPLNARKFARKLFLREHAPWFSALNAVLLVSYVGLRLCWFPYLLSVLWAGRERVVLQHLGGPPALFYGGLFALGFLLLLSTGFIALMLRGGLRRFLTLQPPEKPVQRQD